MFLEKRIPSAGCICTLNDTCVRTQFIFSMYIILYYYKLFDAIYTIGPVLTVNDESKLLISACPF